MTGMKQDLQRNLRAESRSCRVAIFGILPCRSRIGIKTGTTQHELSKFLAAECTLCYMQATYPENCLHGFMFRRQHDVTAWSSPATRRQVFSGWGFFVMDRDWLVLIWEWGCLRCRHDFGDNSAMAVPSRNKMFIESSIYTTVAQYTDRWVISNCQRYKVLFLHHSRGAMLATICLGFQPARNIFTILPMLRPQTTCPSKDSIAIVEHMSWSSSCQLRCIRHPSPYAKPPSNTLLKIPSWLSINAAAYE